MKINTLELLESAPWDEIVPTLMKFALNRLRGPNSKDIAYDVVMESIRKIFDGTRAWDPETKNDLTMHLKGVVRSEIDHLRNNFASKAIEQMPEEGEVLPKRANPIEEHTAGLGVLQPLTPAEVLEDKEQLALDEAEMREILKEVEGVSELEDVVLCIMGGVFKPREIAATLGVDVSAVYNIQKKLRRIYRGRAEGKERRNVK